jgi:putative ABC transport system permease protein
MFKNYLKIAWRNLFKYKVFSFINISGLSIGLLVSMLIFAFVTHEVTYDQFHVNGRRIFKLSVNMKYGDQTVSLSAMPAGLAPSIQSGSPEVMDFVRMKNAGEIIFKNQANPELKFKENTMVFTDPSFFSVFSFKLSRGDFHSVLSAPFSLIISKKIQNKYFGNEDPVGKSLLCNNTYLYTVTGVLEDIPSNSSLNVDFISSLETYPKLGNAEAQNWAKAGAFDTYLLLKSEQSTSRVLPVILENGKKIGTFTDETEYSLSQYSSQHLGGGFEKNTNARYVYIFSGIAILILFLALFNYVSLTTARSTFRAKEVGVRKVVGANRTGLMRQFYVESFILCFIAFATAFILLTVLRQPFYSILNIHIDDAFLSHPLFLKISLGLFLLSVLFAGSYPAFVLSGFIPIEVLKGNFSSGRSGVNIRKGLMIFQFTVSVVLIICTLVSHIQLRYMRSMDLGYVKDQVMVVPVDGIESGGIMTFKNAIHQLPGVESVSFVTNPFYKGYNAWFTKSLKTKQELMLFALSADSALIHTVQLKWAIPPNSGNSSDKIFVNEIAARELELGEDPVGKLIQLGSSPAEIGGVLKDFHFSNVQQKIEPLMISVHNVDSKDWVMSGGSPSLFVRFGSGLNLKENISVVRDIFNKSNLERPFEYYFLDEAFTKTFANEMRLSTLFNWFTAFAIFIASMGLFGLILFTTQAMIKEIGIRKILGADRLIITVLLTKDFVILVLISIALAIPVAYYVMNKWLLSFAYRIGMDWWIFLIAGIGTLAIAVVTVSFHAFRAANANPVISLRTE